MRNKFIISMVILVLTALTATTVFAQGSTLTVSDTNTETTPQPPGRFPRSEEALSAAANVLGITVDELSAALESGSSIEELATAAGVDVKDVFDAIRAVMPGRGDRFGGPGNSRLSDEALQAAADVLGMTTEELSAALEAGSTLEELATTVGVDFQTVMDAIKAVMPAPDNRPGGPGQMLLNDEALQAVADALGISVDELSAALEEGTTLEELATAAGMKFQTLMEVLRNTMPFRQGQNDRGQARIRQPAPGTGASPFGQFPGGQPPSGQP